MKAKWIIIGVISCLMAMPIVAQQDTTNKAKREALEKQMEELNRQMEELSEKMAKVATESAELATEAAKEAAKQGYESNEELEEAIEKAVEEAMRAIEIANEQMEHEYDRMEEILEEEFKDMEHEWEDQEEQLERLEEELEQLEEEIEEELYGYDTTRIQLGKRRVMIIKEYNDGTRDTTICKEDKESWWEREDEHKHWAGLELGVSGYMTPDFETHAPIGYEYLNLDYARSPNVNINFLEKSIHFVDEHFKMVMGLGFEWNSYALDRNVSLVPGNDVVLAVTDTVVNFEKNKLNNWYVNMPLMLAWNTHNDREKAVHIALGAVAGYRIGSKTKQRYNVGPQKFSPKVKANYNQLPYRLSARVGLGYSKINLYAQYAITSMFESGEGPFLHPFSLGIRVLGF